MDRKIPEERHVPFGRRLAASRAATAAGAATLLLFAAAAAPAPRQAPRPRNVIFVLVDTLRADHLGAYGYGRETSPNFDAFTRGAVLFRNARSQASCTFPSANSLLAARYPAAFLGQPRGAMGIPEGVLSLPEILRARGFRTAAVSASPIVRKSPTRFNPDGGFDRGFETFLEGCLWKPAECVNRRALAQLRSGDRRPFFLYLHYMDPHGPYAPPAAHPRKFATAGARPIDLYDEEIAYFDRQLAVLLRELRDSGRLADTILVFASDHGEEFLEHGQDKHCRTLFDTSIKVPLALWIPGVAPRAVAQPVENLDVVPTVLDYLGISAAGLGLEGRSLRPSIEGRSRQEARQFSAQGPLRSVAGGRFKLIHDLAQGSFALYDLAADPGEKTDVRRRHRRAYHGLRQELAVWLAATEGEAAESVQKAGEAEKRLRALGYLQ